MSSTCVVYRVGIYMTLGRKGDGSRGAFCFLEYTDEFCIISV